MNKNISLELVDSTIKNNLTGFAVGTLVGYTIVKAIDEASGPKVSANGIGLSTEKPMIMMWVNLAVIFAFGLAGSTMSLNLKVNKKDLQVKKPI